MQRDTKVTQTDSKRWKNHHKDSKPPQIDAKLLLLIANTATKTSSAGVIIITDNCTTTTAPLTRWMWHIINIITSLYFYLSPQLMQRTLTLRNRLKVTCLSVYLSVGLSVYLCVCLPGTTATVYVCDISWWHHHHKSWLVSTEVTESMDSAEPAEGNLPVLLTSASSFLLPSLSARKQRKASLI